MSFITSRQSTEIFPEQKLQASVNQNMLRKNSMALQRQRSSNLGLKIKYVVRQRDESPFNPNRSIKSGSNEDKKSDDLDVVIEKGDQIIETGEKKSRESSMSRLTRKLTIMRRSCDRFRSNSLQSESVESENNFNESQDKGRSNSPIRKQSTIKLLNQARLQK